MKIKHLLDRYGLWHLVRFAPPLNEFGPLVNLGLIQMFYWQEEPRTRDFVKHASRSDLATFICLLAAIGETVLDENRFEYVPLGWTEWTTEPRAREKTTG